jgi:putative transposase
MTRPLRIEFPGAYYHLMNRGLAYQPVFKEDADRELFFGLLAECHQMWGIHVLSHCLMGNHYHLLVQTPEANLSRVMRHLDGVYTQQYNRLHRRDGPLFRGRYRAIVVDAEEYLLAVARYIHRNPVEAGLVRYPEVYVWSSCRMYLEEGAKPLWLDSEPLLSRFPEKDRKASFLAFMRSETDEPTQSFYRSAQWLPVMGSKGFVEKVRRWVGRRSGELKEVPQAKRYIRPDAKTCLDVVGRVYGRGEEELKRSRRGERNEARSMAMYVCRKVAGMKQEEIAKEFGLGGYSGVSSVVERVQAEMEKGGEIVVRFERIRNLLQR